MKTKSFTNASSRCLTPNPNTPCSSAFIELNAKQIERLRTVLNEDVEIHGRENFPTLRITLHKLIVQVRRKLREVGLCLKHVKMNGGAASYVFANDEFVFSDLDLIFPLDLKDSQDFEKVRNAVFQVLLELMPDTTNKGMLCPEILRDIYIKKMVKVSSDCDQWSLFSLHNDFGRQFEFSVDSFQITLDPFLDAEELRVDGAAETQLTTKITAESMFGDFPQALKHLNRRLIDTRNPEEIRGGGLLKYCHLLTKGYSATNNCRDLEKYMCSRFFIDFPDIATQEIKLRGYLDNHFENDDRFKFDYLQILTRVLKESTICLMGHERRLTLSMVDRLRQQLSYNIYYHRQAQVEGFCDHTPRQVLLYLPSNSNQWVRVA